MHPSKRSRKMKCSICQQEYEKIEDIRAHIKGTHLKHLTCPVCDRMFLNIFELTNHKKSHYQPAPDHLFQHSKSIPQATAVKEEKDDKKAPANESKEENRPCDDRGVTAEDSLTLNNSRIDLKTKFQKHPSTSNNNHEVGAIHSSRLNSTFKGSSSNQGDGKIRLSELENGKSLEPYSCLRADDTNESSSFICNEGREQVTHQSSPSKKIFCFQGGNHCKVREVAVTLSKDAATLDEGEKCVLPEAPGLENGISLQPNPQLRADDADDISPFSSNEKKVQLTRKRSSSTELVSFPGENRWKVAKVSDAVSREAALPIEKKCAIEEGESVCWQDEEGSEEAAAVDEEGERDGKHPTPTPPPSREVVDEKPKALRDTLDDTLGVKYTNSTGEYYVESKTEADDKKKNAKKTTATFKIVNTNYDMIPLNDVKLICVTKKIKQPSNNSSTSFYVVDAEGVKAKDAKPLEYTCNVCKNKYTDVVGLRTHMKEAHANHLKCLICDKKFATVSEYLSHSKSHLNIPSPKSKNTESYYGHVEDHTHGGSETSSTTNVEMDSVPSESKQQKESELERVKKYKCKLCSEKYSNLNEIRIHVKEVHLKSFTCGLCQERFTDTYSLMVHAKSHPKTIESGHPSVNINLTMSPKIVPRDHFDRSVYEGSSGFKYSDLKYESGTGDQVREKAVNKCNVCNLYFDSETALLSHSKTHKKILYKCGVCELTSPSKKLVLKHLNEKCHSVSVELNEDH